MVKYNSSQIDSIFFALSDSTRRGIIQSLTKKKRTAQELAEPFEISLPAVSKHLKVLEKAQIIQREILGRTHMFTLNVKTLEKASDWLEFHQNYWEKSLLKMETYLTKNKKEPSC